MTLRNVLIVEDDVLIAQALKITLVEAGYGVCGVAATEAEAVQLAREHQPDFVILDIDLAEGNGISAALQIHRTTSARIVFASAQCQRLQAVAHVLLAWCVPKPYKGGLITEVLDLLRRSASGGREYPLPARVTRIGEFAPASRHETFRAVK